jgi:hypothetical protein
MMDKDAIAQIQESFHFHAIEKIDGLEYLIQPGAHGARLISPPGVKTLETHTLAGVIDFFNDKVEKDAQNLFIWVPGHDQVVILSPINERYKSRDHYLNAQPFVGRGMPEGCYMDMEDFIIRAMQSFSETENLKKLLSFLGSVRSEDVREDGDDGISQKVTVKAGVASLAEAKVPNPIILSPYVTFAEIEQPQITYIFRMKKNKDGGQPFCALFKSDNDSWMIQTVQKIVDYLAKNLKSEIKIIY